MLHESRHENLKILIAPLSINPSSLKSAGTVSKNLMTLKRKYDFYDFVIPLIVPLIDLI